MKKFVDRLIGLLFPRFRFGNRALQKRAMELCNEERIDLLEFWSVRDRWYYEGYAILLHLTGKGQWGEKLDAKAIFLLKDFSDRENRQAEEELLRRQLERVGEPVALTMMVADGRSEAANVRFLKPFGFEKMPGTWEDDLQNSYAVYTKGHFEMGPYVSMVERMEDIGKKVVYRQRRD